MKSEVTWLVRHTASTTHERVCCRDFRYSMQTAFACELIFEKAVYVVDGTKEKNPHDKIYTAMRPMMAYVLS